VQERWMLMLIMVDAVDGAGKTSVARAIAEKLGADFLEFPDRSTPSGKAIDAYLKKHWWCETFDQFTGERRADDLLSAQAFQALHVVNKAEHYEQLRDAKSASPFAHDLVLARYTPSAWVYGQLDGLSRAWIDQIHASLPTPDAALLLDLDADIAMKRRAARDGTEVPPERYEAKITTARRIVELYRELWDRNDDIEGWDVIDASCSFEEVVMDCLTCIERIDT